MKIKSVLLIVFALVSLNTFSQEIKPCLFIGRYDKVKKGICSDRAFVKEGVYNSQEYEEKRQAFLAEHKGENPSTNFVSSKQCVIVYEYQHKISGWDCTPTVYSTKIQATIESCEKEMATYLAKYPKEFKTQPKIVYTWKGKGETQKQTITENLGGVTSTYYILNKANGSSFIVAQISNKTKDQKAIITYKNTEGKMEKDIILPGEVFTKKYATQKLEIKCYKNDVESIDRGVIQDVREFVGRQIINENGKLKSNKIATVVGVRG